MKNHANAILHTTAFIALLAYMGAGDALAQKAPPRPSLPDAPPSRLIAQASAQPNPAAMPDAAGQAPSTSSSSSSDQQPRLTRNEAEQMAIKNNPQVSVSHLLASRATPGCSRNQIRGITHCSRQRDSNGRCNGKPHILRFPHRLAPL